MILIFGATGKTGSEIIKQLLVRHASIRVLIRNPEKAVYFRTKGIDVVIGDANDIEAVTLALKDIEQVYLVLANSQYQLAQEKLITDCAKKSGVKLLVKQSSLETLIYPNNPIPKAHLESENYIKSSGINWVIIRPTFFNQMLLMCAHNIKANNTLMFPMANGCVVPTDVRDVAEVATIVLTEPGHNNKTYNISGSEFLSFSTIATILSKVLNRQVNYVSQPLSEYRKMLETRLNDEWRTNAVCEELNSLSTCSSNYVAYGNIETILGRPPISVEQFVEDYKAAFLKE